MTPAKREDIERTVVPVVIESTAEPDEAETPTEPEEAKTPQEPAQAETPEEPENIQRTAEPEENMSPADNEDNKICDQLDTALAHPSPPSGNGADFPAEAFQASMEAAKGDI